MPDPKNRSQNEQDEFHKRVAGALGGALQGIEAGEKKQMKLMKKSKFKKLPDSFTKPKDDGRRLKKKFVPKPKMEKSSDRTSREFKEKRIKIITGEKDK